MRRAELSGTAAASIACAALGGIGTDPTSLYYRTLRKPRWQPPTLAFPIVWTTLYADIAGTTGQALSVLRDENRNDEYRNLVRALALNLALNTGWTWIFFRAHRRLLATVECAALTLSSADLARRVGRADRRAGWMLAPYAVWCGFATALSGSIARRNRKRP